MFRLLALSLLTVLFSPAAPAAEPETRILTFNLRYQNSGDKNQKSWTVRRELAAGLIKADHPDLIGYQEALRPMLDDLRERIPGYQEIGVGREDGKTKGEYSAIWIRQERYTVRDSGTFWLSETPQVPNSMSWGNRITRICTWAQLQDKTTGRIFHFCNLHLDHQSQESREKGMQQVLKFMESRPPAQPFVLAGDFNAGETNPAILLVKNHALHPVDTWRQLHRDTPAAESGTFHNFTGHGGESKIDYIFVPKTAKLLSAEIMRFQKEGTFPSDHFPVRASIQWPEP